MIEKVLNTNHCKKKKIVPSEPIDLCVGSKIRVCRLLSNLSQSELAEMLGVTFQQIQKYEHGQNRVSASRIYQLSHIFNMPIEFFFVRDSPRDLHAENHSYLDDKQDDLMGEKETVELIRTYYKIKNIKVRKSFLEMLKSLIESKEI